MNVKVTVGLVVLLLVGMAVVVIVGDPPPVDVGPEGLWPDFVAADVSEISWSSKEGEIRLRRSPVDVESWELSAGETWVPAELAPVLEVLNELRRVEVLHREPGEVVDAGLRAESGLDLSTQSVNIRLRGQAITLTLGGAALGGESIYAARQDSDDVFVISDDLQETLLDYTVKDLRQRRLFRWSVDDVDRIEIRKGKEPHLVVGRKEDERLFWWATQPFVDYLRYEFEREVVAMILLLEVSEFVADMPDVVALGDAGLVTPVWRVTVRKSRGENIVRTVLLGAPVPEMPGMIYFMVEDQPFLYAGKGDTLLAHLSKDPLTYRDRNLSRLGIRPLGNVRGEYGETVFRLDRREKVWTVTEPEGMAADPISVDDWFASVRRLEILEFLDDPDLDALGLSEPAGRLTFWMPPDPGEDSGDVAVSLHIGHRTEKGVYVRRTSQDGAAFLVGPELLDLLTPGAWQFRAKAVFLYRPRGVGATRVVKKGVAGDYVTKFRDGKWTAEAVADRVNGYVGYLLNLQAARWVGPAAGHGSEYGLGEKPEGSVRITIGSGEDAVEYGLVIGKETNGGRYARAIRDGKPGEAIFVLPSVMEKLVFVTLTKPPEKTAPPEDDKPEDDKPVKEKGK